MAVYALAGFKILPAIQHIFGNVVQIRSNIQSFDAIHKEKDLDPNNEKALIDWVTLNGKLDKKEVKSAFNSFSIDTKLKKSYKIFKEAGATGVPTIIIDGNYMTSSTMAGGEQNAIDITNYIIENIRNDKKKSN